MIKCRDTEPWFLALPWPLTVVKVLLYSKCSAIGMESVGGPSAVSVWCGCVGINWGQGVRMDRNQCYQEEGHDVVLGMCSMVLGRTHVTKGCTVCVGSYPKLRCRIKGEQRPTPLIRILEGPSCLGVRPMKYRLKCIKVPIIWCLWFIKIYESVFSFHLISYNSILYLDANLVLLFLFRNTP